MNVTNINITAIARAINSFFIVAQNYETDPKLGGNEYECIPEGDLVKLFAAPGQIDEANKGLQNTTNEILNNADNISQETSIENIKDYYDDYVNSFNNENDTSSSVTYANENKVEPTVDENGNIINGYIEMDIIISMEYAEDKVQHVQIPVKLDVEKEMENTSTRIQNSIESAISSNIDVNNESQFNEYINNLENSINSGQYSDYLGSHVNVDNIECVRTESIGPNPGQLHIGVDINTAVNGGSNSHCDIYTEIPSKSGEVLNKVSNNFSTTNTTLTAVKSEADLNNEFNTIATNIMNEYKNAGINTTGLSVQSTNTKYTKTDPNTLHYGSVVFTKQFWIQDSSGAKTNISTVTKNITVTNQAQVNATANNIKNAINNGSAVGNISLSSNADGVKSAIIAYAKNNYFSEISASNLTFSVMTVTPTAPTVYNRGSVVINCTFKLQGDHTSSTQTASYTVTLDNLSEVNRIADACKGVIDNGTACGTLSTASSNRTNVENAIKSYLNGYIMGGINNNITFNKLDVACTNLDVYRNGSVKIDYTFTMATTHSVQRSGSYTKTWSNSSEVDTAATNCANAINNGSAVGNLTTSSTRATVESAIKSYLSNYLYGNIGNSITFSTLTVTPTAPTPVAHGNVKVVYTFTLTTTKSVTKSGSYTKTLDNTAVAESCVNQINTYINNDPILNDSTSNSNINRTMDSIKNGWVKNTFGQAVANSITFTPTLAITPSTCDTAGNIRLTLKTKITGGATIEKTITKSYTYSATTVNARLNEMVKDLELRFVTYVENTAEYKNGKMVNRTNCNNQANTLVNTIKSEYKLAYELKLQIQYAEGYTDMSCTVECYRVKYIISYNNKVMINNSENGIMYLKK